MTSSRRPAFCASLLCLFVLTALTGCQNKDRGTAIATYSGSIEGGSETITLTANRKYTQSITPGSKGPILLNSAAGTWYLIDTRTNLPINSNAFASADLKDANVVLKKAIGPMPWQENHVSYMFLDRSLPASDFRLVRDRH